jgi:PAS domain S-box-containing protein
MDETPMDADVARSFRTVLDADGPVKFGPGTPNALSGDVPERFDIQSFMAMALYPKVDKPWQFGIHQCSHARIWTLEEERLFQEIGQRLTDALTSLLAHRHLQESEERYRALYLDNPSMFFTLNSDGEIISVNAFGASQLGYTIDELEGQSVLKTFYKEDRATVMTHLQNCLQNPTQINSWQLRKERKDGSLLWVEEFARTVIDPNGAINILVVCQDISDRMQGEMERERLLDQIREKAQQVQYIIDTVPEGVILLSQDQSITLTNPVAEQFLTLLVPEWKNGRITHLGQRPLAELLTSPPKGLWHEILSDDFAFEAIARPVEQGPENSGWVLVLRDVTQERDIQRRVQQQNRLAAVGQLAAGIAHDFNNILAVIGLYTEVISRTTQMPAHTKEQLHTIEQQINRATDLIQQILDFSRQSVLDRQPLDLLPFMENLVTLLERTLPEHVQIEFDYAAGTYFIQADPTRIQQVMMNLAVNARDAMPEGGYLQIKLAHMQMEETKLVTVQELPPGDWIQIEVTDSGNGIPPELLANIFEPFFTTKEQGQGTGLGLAQVYGIIQQHEGYIDVRTELGQGTTFFLYFQAFDTGGDVVSTPERFELQMGQGQKILLVEDDDTTRKALLESLAMLNYEVMAATNGHEALAILETKADEIDLVLSDVVMPEMGGVALFHAMRDRNLAIPVALLTGHPLGKELDNLKALGLVGWYSKPIDLVKMSYVLAELLPA